MGVYWTCCLRDEGETFTRKLLVYFPSARFSLSFRVVYIDHVNPSFLVLCNIYRLFKVNFGILKSYVGPLKKYYNEICPLSTDSFTWNFDPVRPNSRKIVVASSCLMYSLTQSVMRVNRVSHILFNSNLTSVIL